MKCEDMKLQVYEIERPFFGCEGFNYDLSDVRLIRSMVNNACNQIGITPPEQVQLLSRNGPAYCMYNPPEWHYRQKITGLLSFARRSASRLTVAHEVAHWVTGPRHGHCRHFIENYLDACEMLFPNRLDIWHSLGVKFKACGLI